MVGVIIGIVLVGIRMWLQKGVLSAGDWGFRFPEMIREATPWTVGWSTFFGGGLGGTKLILAPLDTWFLFWTQVTERLGLPWPFVERFFWFMPAFILGAIGGIVLSRRVSEKPFSVIGSIVVLNTYFLLVFSGGQLGVFWAIALAPWVFDQFLGCMEKLQQHGHVDIHGWITFLSVTAFQVLFDVRFFYITLIAIVLYILWITVRGEITRDALLKAVVMICVVGVGVFCLHAFWMVPLLFYPTSPQDVLSSAYTSSDALKFFSFADFSHAISLLHPNWPENIFGKTYFLQPEFLLFPILAMASLLFVSRENRGKKTTILYFVFLGILGAFLSKGVQEPFGFVYRWLFTHIPGFIFFRDPTKFFLLTALAYAVLIPYTLEHVSRLVQSRWRKVYLSSWIIVLIFTVLWMGLHREFIGGYLGGTLKAHPVPPEYGLIMQKLRNDPEYARVLWIPDRSRYGYYADNHPAVSLETVGVSSVSAFPSWLLQSEHLSNLSSLSVGYIVVPTDPRHELFVTDRKYDDALRTRTIASVRTIPDIQEISGVGSIALFKLSSHKAHIVEKETGMGISSFMVRPTLYTLTLRSSPGTYPITFSEHYDPYWRLIVGSQSIAPQKSALGLQEYLVPANSTHGTLQYLPEHTANIGFIISAVSLVSFTALWFVTRQVRS